MKLRKNKLKVDSKYISDIDAGIRYFFLHTSISSLICSENIVRAANTPLVNLLDVKSESQLLKKKVSDFIHPEYLQVFTLYIQDILGLEQNKQRAGLQIKLCQSSGSSLNVELTAMPLTWQGRPAILIHFFDSSERNILQEELERLKLSEKKLLENEKQFKLRIHEEIEKGRKHERLLMQQSKLATMGEMVAAIAHQWRQPLTAIGFIVQNIETAYKQNTINENYLEKEVKDAMSQIKFMSKTIDGFRNFFITSGDKGSYDVIEMIEESLALMHAQLENSYIYVKLNKPTVRPLLTSGYPIEFKQVILNIIQNAKNAITDRGAAPINKYPGASPVETDSGASHSTKNAHPGDGEHGLIIIDISSLDNDIIIKIWNNGVPIPEEVIHRIFEPFYTYQGRGMGIGLYMSKVIIEKNSGGRISAENKEDGVLFTLRMNKYTDETSK